MTTAAVPPSPTLLLFRTLPISFRLHLHIESKLDFIIISKAKYFTKQGVLLPKILRVLGLIYGSGGVKHPPWNRVKKKTLTCEQFEESRLEFSEGSSTWRFGKMTLQDQDHRCGRLDSRPSCVDPLPTTFKFFLLNKIRAGGYYFFRTLN